MLVMCPMGVCVCVHAHFLSLWKKEPIIFIRSWLNLLGGVTSLWQDQQH